MDCNKCGTKNAENMKYCCKCGEQLPQNGKKGKRWVWISATSILAVSIAAGILVPYTVQANQKKQLKSKLSMGEKYLEEMQYEKAAALYLDAIDIEEKEPDAYMGLAAAYLGLEEYDRADQAYEAAVIYKEKAQEEAKQSEEVEQSEEVVQSEQSKPPEERKQSEEAAMQSEEEEIPAVYEDVIKHYADQETEYKTEAEEEPDLKTDDTKNEAPKAEDSKSENPKTEKPKIEDSKDQTANNSVPEDNGKTVISEFSGDASKEDTGKEDKNSYDAFYELIQKYEKEKGKGQIKSQTMNDNTGYMYSYLEGLCFAKLGDFDGDKSEELLVVFGTMSFTPKITEHAYTAEIWKYEKGSLYQINPKASQPFYLYDGGRVEVQLVQVNGQTYLIQGAADEGEHNEVMGIDKSGDFAEITALELEYDIDGTQVCKMDQEEVERSVYEQAYTKWCEPKKAYALYKSEKEEKQTLREYEATVIVIKEKMTKKEQTAKQAEQTKESTDTDKLKREMTALESYMNDPDSPVDHGIIYCLPESLEGVPYREKMWWFPIYDVEDVEKAEPLYYALTSWDSDTDNQAYIYAAESVDMPLDSELAETKDEPEAIADLTGYYQ